MHFLFARRTADWPHGGATSHLIKGSMKPSHTTAWSHTSWYDISINEKCLTQTTNAFWETSEVTLDAPWKHKTRRCSPFGPDISSTHRYSTAVMFTSVRAEQQHRKPHIWCSRYTASPLQHPQTPLSSQHPLTSFPWGSLAHLMH